MYADAEALLVRAQRNSSLARVLNSNWQVSGPVYEGRYSQIFRIHGSTFPSGLGLKLCLNGHNGPDPYMAEHQFRIHKKVFPAMRAICSEYRVCEPVAVIPESAALIMEWAPGSTLAAIITDRHRTQSEILSGARSAGLWLRQFHRLSNPKSGLADEMELADEIDQLTRKLSPHGKLAARMRAALTRAARAVPQLARIPMRKTWLHGDFQTANVVLGKNGVYGLDFSYACRSFTLLDVAHMVTNIRRLTCTPSGWRRFPMRNLIVGAFVSSYFGEEGEMGSQREALTWFELLSSIRYALSFSEQETSGFRSWTFGKVQALHVASALGRIEPLVES